jgi:hypothetical protein
MRARAARLPVLRTRVPPPMLDAVEAAAELNGATVSATIRELVAVALAARGLWPPAPPVHRGRR